MKITFESFLEQVEARNPREINRRTDACDWFWGDVELCHERSRWGLPRNLSDKTPIGMKISGFLKETLYSYWPNSFYTDFAKAEADAQKYGGKVIEEFYCDEDNKAWFVGFNDLDRVLKYCFDKLVENRIIKVD